jgi:hypothetical protein
MTLGIKNEIDEENAINGMTAKEISFKQRVLILEEILKRNVEGNLNFIAYLEFPCGRVRLILA